MEKICIIIPVYNVEKYLSDCINSILAQSLKNFRLILVNDGSNDNSLDICNQFEQKDKRITVLSQENKGAAAARNTGIDWALKEEKADLIGFVDSDDWVHPDYLLGLYEGIVSSGCKISMCDSYRSNTRDYLYPTERFSCEIYTPEYMWCHDRNLCVVPWGKLFKVELFDTIRFPENARAAEDEFVSYKVLFRCNSICYNISHLYCYYQSDNSIMRSKWTPKRMIGLQGLEQQLDFFYSNGFKKALQESAHTYLYMVNEYIGLTKGIPEYKSYYTVLKKKLKDGVNAYYHKYSFPIRGTEWVYELTHPIRGRVFLALSKLNKNENRNSE